MESYLARPKLRSEDHRKGIRQPFGLHLKDWMRLPLDEISKSMAVERHRALGEDAIDCKPFAEILHDSVEPRSTYLRLARVSDDGHRMVRRKVIR